MLKLHVLAYALALSAMVLQAAEPPAPVPTAQATTTTYAACVLACHTDSECEACDLINPETDNEGE